MSALSGNTPHRFVCLGSSGLTSWCWVFACACCFRGTHSAVLCLLGLWLRFVVWKVEGEGVVSDLSSRYGSHCPNVGHVLLKVWCVSMAPLHVGAPFGCRGCCVWHACVESVFGLGFGGVGGASPHVWVPQCVAGVSAVLTFSHTLPYCSPYCGALPSTSRVFGPLASPPLSCIGSLSVSHTHTPTYPIPFHAIPRGSVVPVVGPPQHCRSAVPPQPTPTHTPLLPQGCHAPDVLRVSLLVCVCSQRHCFLFPCCCVSTLVCCPSHLATPL